MAAPKRQAVRRARDLRERFRQSGTEFLQAEFRSALADELRDFQGEAYDGFVDNIAEKIDEESRRESSNSHSQGELFDLGGEYALGEGRRIAKQHAMVDHAEEALAIDDGNLIAVQEANLRKRRELIRLRPFWGAGVTKQQAVEAFQASELAEPVPS